MNFAIKNILETADNMYSVHANEAYGKKVSNT